MEDVINIIKVLTDGVSETAHDKIMFLGVSI